MCCTPDCIITTITPLTCRSIAKEYLRLLKFADSQYRCKQLKKAALGRLVSHRPN